MALQRSRSNQLRYPIRLCAHRSRLIAFIAQQSSGKNYEEYLLTWAEDNEILEDDSSNCTDDTLHIGATGPQVHRQR